MRRAFWKPIIALPTTKPETAAVVMSCALWLSEARDTHEGILTNNFKLCGKMHPI